MALEAEQVQRRNQPTHLSCELELQIEGRQQPLTTGSQPGCGFSLTQGAEPLALNLLGQPTLSPSQ